jgi:hypothetical protein
MAVENVGGVGARKFVIRPAKQGARGDGSGRVRAPSSAPRSSIRRPPTVGRTISDTLAVAAYSLTRSSMCAPMPDGSTDGA